jgi:hypothetical protein
MGGAMSKTNVHDTREAWLRAATKEYLPPYFERAGYVLPAKIRFAIAFPSTGRKGNRVGECWHPGASADGSHEIIIRADQSEPVKVLGILFHQLTHAVLPPDAGHGELFKAAARKLDLEGSMRHAMPNKWLRGELAGVAERLGPLPHAELFIARGATGLVAADRPKPQKNRYLKAHCEAAGCTYWVRLVAACVAIGAPPCPLHGPMSVVEPAGTAGDEAGD